MLSIAAVSFFTFAQPEAGTEPKVLCYAYITLRYLGLTYMKHNTLDGTQSDAA